MRSLPVLLAILSLSLAGCSSGGGSDPDTQEAEPEPDFGGVQATATTGVIRGVVVDEAIRPLANVNVSLTDSGRSVLTTDNGAFGFDGLEPGTYFVQAVKLGFGTVQQSVEVQAGVDEPPIAKMVLPANPSTAPYFEAYSYDAFITCGAAIVATSVGCNTFPDVGEALGDRVYFRFEFTSLPMWTQGELVWEQTQPAGGAMIWEIVDPNYPGAPQPHTGYRETGPSPALAYINTTVLKDSEEWAVGDAGEGNGVQYRIFAGPHPTCTGVGFGCGITLNQKMTGYIHHFYNFAPTEGWRFYYDGDPKVPE